MYAYIYAKCTYIIIKLRIQDDLLFITTRYFITNLKQYVQTSMVLHLTWLSTYKVQSPCATFMIFDFKLSLCPECCMLSSVWFTGVCSLNANVSEQTECSETLAFKLQMPVNHPEDSIQHLWCVLTVSYCLI
jgi:hypothetical protein